MITQKEIDKMKAEAEQASKEPWGGALSIDCYQFHQSAPYYVLSLIEMLEEVSEDNREYRETCDVE